MIYTETDMIRINNALDAMQIGARVTDKLCELYSDMCTTIIVREEDGAGFCLADWFVELGDAAALVIEKAARENVGANQRYLDLIAELLKKQRPSRSKRVRGAAA